MYSAILYLIPSVKPAAEPRDTLLILFFVFFLVGTAAMQLRAQCEAEERVKRSLAQKAEEEAINTAAKEARRAAAEKKRLVEEDLRLRALEAKKAAIVRVHVVLLCMGDARLPKGTW